VEVSVKISKIIATASLFFFAQSSFAGVMVEPWVGYGTGKLNCTDLNTGADCGAKVSGINYGARLGYKVPVVGVWGALEYDGSAKLKSESNVSTGTPEDEVVHTSLGLTVGWDLIFGLRVFGGYNFQEKLTITSGDPTNPGDTIIDGGNSVKIGAGYKFPLIPLAINLEMVNGTYKDFKTPSQSGKISDVFSTYKSSTTILSVSAPFDF